MIVCLTSIKVVVWICLTSFLDSSSYLCASSSGYHTLRLRKVKPALTTIQLIYFVFCMPTENKKQHEPPAQQSKTQSPNKQNMTTALHAEPSALARICPTDADTRVPDANKNMDKQSVEYVLKSGLAGGLAGCAVRSVVKEALQTGTNRCI